MFSNEALQLTQEALWLILLLSAPPVAAAVIVGLVIAVIQPRRVGTFFVPTRLNYIPRGHERPAHPTGLLHGLVLSCR
ncbi:MAG: flagellar biosynthetic protein FliQ [Gammaproteobacteria bacterium]|nr:flagellar biosynthetic protein FliQ [Gammaproteobacteria bacterium]MCF6363286.1 flagellar biosynthetic protein FliQ [Gammaproteobacteria bacterium]